MLDPIVTLGMLAGSLADPAHLAVYLVAAVLGAKAMRWIFAAALPVALTGLQVMLLSGIDWRLALWIDALGVAIFYLAGRLLRRLYRPPTAEERSGARAGAASPGAHQKPLP